LRLYVSGESCSDAAAAAATAAAATSFGYFETILSFSFFAGNVTRRGGMFQSSHLFTVLVDGDASFDPEWPRLLSVAISRQAQGF
jgi:hypothetical protein